MVFHFSLEQTKKLLFYSGLSLGSMVLFLYLFKKYDNHTYGKYYLKIAKRILRLCKRLVRAYRGRILKYIRPDGTISFVKTLPKRSSPNTIRCMAISDIHYRCIEKDMPLPSEKFDLLLITGDLFDRTSSVPYGKQLQHIDAYFGECGHFSEIVFIGGNHDAFLETKEGKAAVRSLKYMTSYLENEEVILFDSLHIYGSPCSLKGHSTNIAFQIPKENQSQLKAIYGSIPSSTDILLTHGPPYGIRDGHSGCKMLRDVVCNRVQPKIHLFGHYHIGTGSTKVKDTVFVNASTMGYMYLPYRPFLIFDYDLKKKSLV
mmetsp:Transcript_2228/g.3231  ORF Transcript_2228/g.3231 Transcript_2228/m.3231 type:complete len:316 (+) Transcript_2228:1268-2215(+)